MGYQVLYEQAAEAIHHWAPRAHNDVERGATERAFIAGKHMTYIWLKHFRGARRAVFPVWWFLIGERQSYGILKALWALIADPRVSWPVVRASFRGRIAGMRAWQAYGVRQRLSSGDAGR